MLFDQVSLTSLHIIYVLLDSTWGHSSSIIYICCHVLRCQTLSCHFTTRSCLQEIMWLPGIMVESSELSTWGAVALPNAHSHNSIFNKWYHPYSSLLLETPVILRVCPGVTLTSESLLIVSNWNLTEFNPLNLPAFFSLSMILCIFNPLLKHISLYTVYLVTPEIKNNSTVLVFIEKNWFLSTPQLLFEWVCLYMHSCGPMVSQVAVSSTLLYYCGFTHSGLPGHQTYTADNHFPAHFGLWGDFQYIFFSFSESH